MEKIILEDLEKALRFCWSRETSADPETWHSDNSSWGQCCVTALVVQDFFGGILLRAVTNTGSHYWNKLPGGEEKDLTMSQFSKSTIIPPGEVRTREYVLSYPDTVKRYKILKEKVEKFLRDEEIRRMIE